MGWFDLGLILTPPNSPQIFRFLEMEMEITDYVCAWQNTLSTFFPPLMCVHNYVNCRFLVFIVHKIYGSKTLAEETND